MLHSNNKNKSGFTLLELMLVITILVIIAFIGKDFYANFALDANIDNSAKTIMFDLRSVRDKAMNSQSMNGMTAYKNWGIHFVNGASDYYEIFSTDSNYADAGVYIESTTYLNGNIIFSSPPSSSSTDIIFSNTSGLVATSTSIIIVSGTNSRTINVSTQGLIY